MAANTPWIVVDFGQLPAVACPCGTSQRAFADVPEFPGTIHRTEIGLEAKPHFHRRHTETYYILHCDDDAALELDGQRVAVRPGMCVVIPPNVVHRAVARMTILNIVFPKFDPADEVVIEHAEMESYRPRWNRAPQPAATQKSVGTLRLRPPPG